MALLLRFPGATSSLLRLVQGISQVSYFYYSHFTPWFRLNYPLPVMEDIVFTFFLLPYIITLLDTMVNSIFENNNLQTQSFS